MNAISLCRRFRILALGLCLAGGVRNGWAFLGATPEAVSDVYGPGRPETADASAAPDGTNLRFSHAGLEIQARFHDGHCIRIAYYSPAWERERIAELQQVHAGASEWAETDPPRFFDPARQGSHRPLRAWKRNDGQAFCHFFNNILEFVSLADIDVAAEAQAERRAQAEQIRLRQVAEGSDRDAALTAVAALLATGDDPSAADALNAARRQLAESRRSLTQVLRQFPPDAVAAARERAAGQAEARARIDRLVDQPELLNPAHRAHREWTRLHERREREREREWRHWQALRVTVEHHESLHTALKALFKDTGFDANDPAETALDETLQSTFDTDRHTLRRFPGPTDAPPKTAYLAELWLHDYNQRIRTYNDALIRNRVVSRGEADHLDILNTYRAALGLRMLELDEQLVNAARGHSREMVEKRFFSHESPTPANRTFQMRISAAGYPNPGGENIAAGRADGKTAFWMWFDSPGHHQNMVRPTFVAVGVGNWRDHWTQNFGNGPIHAIPLGQNAQEIPE